MTPIKNFIEVHSYHSKEPILISVLNISEISNGQIITFGCARNVLETYEELVEKIKEAQRNDEYWMV